VVAHVKSLGVTGVYFSNDIDGTDARFAQATGTPETGGLEPNWVVALIGRLGREVGPQKRRAAPRRCPSRHGSGK
jgi:agmatinase